MSYKLKILKVMCDWVDVKNDCRTTINKEDTPTEPSTDFKKKLLISEHSPIRELQIKWIWRKMKYWVHAEIARHFIGFLKFISSQRTDRTNIPRDKKPQDAPVEFKGVANAQGLINMSRFRLCYGCAAPEAREEIEKLKIAIKDVEPEIADVMVPNCIYRGNCPEFKPCSYITNFYKKHPELNVNSTIQERYDLYNNDFYTINGKD